MQLNFKFSLEIDIKRVRFTIKKLDWYDSHGIKPRMPRKNGECILDEKELMNIIKEEYSEDEYEQKQKELETRFKEIEFKLSKLFENYFKFVPASFEVSLTKYGTGGSYNLPNQITLNIRGKNPFQTLIHEMVHLFIEERVVKEGLSHSMKEELVESFMNSSEIKNLLESQIL